MIHFLEIVAAGMGGTRVEGRCAEIIGFWRWEMIPVGAVLSLVLEGCLCLCVNLNFVRS